MGNALRPILAACALAAVIAGAAWWIHEGFAPSATTPPAAPTDTTTDVGVVVDPPKPATRTIVVRVVDAEDEHAISGAHVRLRGGGD